MGKKKEQIAPFVLDRSIGGGNFSTTDEIYWTGWEAAFIKSKHQSVKQEKCPNRDNVRFPGKDTDIIVESMAPIGQYSYTQLTSEEAPGLQSDKLSYSNMWYNPDAEHYSTVAELVARLTKLARSAIEWELFPPATHEIFSENLDSILIKLVLSLLDMDDVVYSMKSETNNSGMIRLFRKVDLDQERRLMPVPGSVTFSDGIKLSIKVEKKVMNQIAEDSFGSEVFEGFDEVDVNTFVKHCARLLTSESDVYGMLPYHFPRYDDLDTRQVTDDLDTKQVIEEMKTFVPLKAGFKLQLNLELDFYGKCWHMVDYLFVEACKGFVNDKLLKDLGRVYYHGTRRTPESALIRFLEMLHRGIYRLYHYKCSMIRIYREAALNCLGRSYFGKFADEVVQVVEKADHERRLRGDRFIGVQVLLHCLAFSRVGNHELVKSAISVSSHDKPPERPPHKIYKLAGECADHFDAEKVQLEHLVLAVVSVKEDRPGYLYNSKYMTGLKDEKAEFKGVWGGNILKMDSKPVRGYRALVEAVLAGVELPDIRGAERKHEEEQVVWKCIPGLVKGDQAAVVSREKCILPDIRVGGIPILPWAEAARLNASAIKI